MLKISHTNDFDPMNNHQAQQMLLKKVEDDQSLNSKRLVKYYPSVPYCIGISREKSSGLAAVPYK